MKKLKKINKIEEINKEEINCRHVRLFNNALDSIEILLNNFFEDVQKYSGDNLELPKNLIATLDFLISAIAKIQKGQRLALDLDKCSSNQDSEPQINVIEGINFEKV